ncbi:MAG: hypothetical protein K0V04_41055 [Deltaproteobacteria bacterium]|nr:hypothetical protein [Deltaproteobacteria bacterium]
MVVRDRSKQREALVRRVRRAHPELAGRGDAWLDGFVRDGIDNAESVGFSEDEDIYRFMVLPLRLSPQQRASAMINGLVVRALDQTRWAPTRRLDFIYEHVLPRTPGSRSDTELEPLFGSVVASDV